MNSASTRLAALLRIRSNEGRMVALVSGLMFFASAGGAVGSPGIEALFYNRFGVEFLPFMYVALGIITIVTSLLITALLARAARERLYVILPLVLAAILAAERFILTFGFNWFYPVLWLGMNVMWVLQNLSSWGLAGVVCDTRQAKRLFPLFSVGGIIGLTAGSLATRLLVEFINAENLILVWSGGLVLSFFISQSLMRGAPATGRGGPRQAASPLQELQKGYRFARRSSLIRWMALAAVLFAVLFYALVFPFAQAASVEFPDENDLAGFLGIFQGASTGVAILASLLLANRLYARLGFMATILANPIIYLIGFVVVSVRGAFPLLVAFRFTQNAWAAGVAEGADQAMYNVVPPEQREQTRAFVRGVANQLGISLAGIMLLAADRVLQPQHVFFIGAAAAAVTTYFVWRARRAYGPAVVDALRAGQSHIFFGEEEPFGGFRRDAPAVAAAIAGIGSPDVSVRRVSAEILGNLSLPEATDAIVRALDDDDASVRAALLRAIARAGASSALLEVVNCLNDEEPEVRLQAIDSLRALAGYPGGVKSHVEPLLQDPDAAVRSRSAAVLLQFEDHDRAEATLRALAGSDVVEERVQALRALSDWGSQAAYDLAAEALADERPAVRRVAATVLSQIDIDQCSYALMPALADHDRTVRLSVAEAIGRIGEPALEPTVEALRDPDREAGALLALRYLPARQATQAIQDYARGKVNRALHYYELWQIAGRVLATLTDQDGHADRLALLVDALKFKALGEGSKALLASGLLSDSGAIALAVENLDSRFASQRANAIETLESLGDADVVRPLLPLWEPPETPPAVRDGWLLPLLEDTDPWLRACSALAAGFIGDDMTAQSLARLADSDPEEHVRECAQAVLGAAGGEETGLVLPLMERILFFRRVPLFAGLPPSDLLQVARAAGEVAFNAGETIARQDEPGDVMYVIVSGQVDVIFKAAGGSSTKIDEAGPGEYVGEMAVINRRKRTATLIAATDVRALYIDRSEFEQLIAMRPDASLAVMRVLSQRLRAAIAGVPKAVRTGFPAK